MMQHRCAVLGAVNAYHTVQFATNMDILKQVIQQTVQSGFLTFVTPADQGYELEAARFILQLRESNPAIKLIPVLPYPDYRIYPTIQPIFTSVIRKADYVKYLSKTKIPNHREILTAWIVKRCKRVLCVTNFENATLNRVSKLDLTDREVIWIPQRQAKKQDVSYQKQVVSYPENLLLDICNTTKEETPDVFRLFPTDIEARLENVLALLTEREQHILNLRYREKYTLERIGEEIDRTRERVRQILKRSLKKLCFSRRMAYLRGESDSPLPVKRKSKHDTEKEYDQEQGEA